MQDRRTNLNFFANPFHYWSGHFANYTATLFLWGQAWKGGVSLGTAVYLFLAGFLLWTLTEYFLHRFLYHSNNSIFGYGHGLHHENGRLLLGMSFIINITMLGIFYFAFSRVFGTENVGLLLGSFWFGHIVYTWIHHGVHHWSWFRSTFPRICEHHQIHHRHARCNWAVTLPLWDIIFRTRERCVRLR